MDIVYLAYIAGALQETTKCPKNDSPAYTLRTSEGVPAILPLPEDIARKRPTQLLVAGTGSHPTGQAQVLGACQWASCQG
jgi:hypothetical protein